MTPDRNIPVGAHVEWTDEDGTVRTGVNSGREWTDEHEVTVEQGYKAMTVKASRLRRTFGEIPDELLLAFDFLDKAKKACAEYQEGLEKRGSFVFPVRPELYMVRLPLEPDARLDIGPRFEAWAKTMGLKWKPQSPPTPPSLPPINYTDPFSPC